MTAVPILPSLRGEADDGWDARLPIKGVPNYYQFKLSDYLVRSNAKYFNEPPFYTNPYYRIALHRRDNNRQHQRLRELSRKAPETYYVAPETSDVAKFNDFFLNSSVIDVSRMIPVRDCEDISDDRQHFITYQKGRTRWHEHSEPVRHEWSILGSEHESFLDSQRDSAKRLDLDFARKLWETNSKLAGQVLTMESPRRQDEEQTLIPETEHTRKGFLKAAADIAMTYFGATLVIIGEVGQ